MKGMAESKKAILYSSLGIHPGNPKQDKGENLI
jgi:hypothetical protein